MGNKKFTWSGLKGILSHIQQFKAYVGIYSNTLVEDTALMRHYAETLQLMTVLLITNLIQHVI